MLTNVAFGLNHGTKKEHQCQTTDIRLKEIAFFNAEKILIINTNQYTIQLKMK